MVKKLAIICNYELLENRVGGMDYFFWEFDKACRKQHIYVDWFFPNNATHGHYKNLNIISANYKPLEYYVIDYITIHKPNYGYIITHFMELCTSFYAKIKKHLDVNIIAVNHNSRPINGYSLKKRIKKRIKGVLYAKYIDEFIGVSRYTKQAILNDFGNFLENKIQIIYNGISIDRITAKTDERQKNNPKFLVVSYLRFSKGIQDVIKAVHSLPEALKKDLKIDIYGDGPYKDKLFKLVLFYKLESVFDFKGSRSDLYKRYHQYDYLIHPSYEETFGYSVIEAMAANVIPITTHEGGNVLNVLTDNKNSFLFEAKDINKLSALLKHIIKGKLYIEGNTRTLIEDRFSINTMVDNYIKLLS